ncbi:acetyltransferase (GNAT) family protein [Curtobacterium sp. PhB25]|uniref:GNAT family N-acetyltransferase n=1 Tax=unclassified Curtobacterium TaxID=257496 RepID=UPI0010D45EB8|nr:MULTISPECIES: GNAT family N-acetyltransferase [unclassified Curtobacterium]TCU81708.1 acetyltransferase (GNAT) family protein [Curtobacterium sp. PhB191]TDW48430.1 acetyltransferase (GNAT) family protein [Curtobacterium sp. PhB42]TDW53729.1 acetyltransferase (GNAT) family protein [Curtobacterium sp. PhB190]TDW64107.1 acetyltransferase (GNAT) family protein [Curtobacterium sp. PhB25]
MITIERVSWDDPRSVVLRARMDDEMHERYGSSNGDEDPAITAERSRALSVDPSTVVASVLALDESGEAVGHIAIRRLGDEVELKRLIVLTSARGKGAATALLDECERIGRELGTPRLILQTGDKQPDAVALYEKTGWSPIPVYAPYAATMPWSFCFEKAL